jgi:hypothetical protein
MMEIMKPINVEDGSETTIAFDLNESRFFVKAHEY